MAFSPTAALLLSAIRIPTGQARIYVVPSAGGTARRVTPNGPAYFHGWSPDGKTISFTSQHGDNFRRLYNVLLPVGPRNLSSRRTATWPEFSPDGQWIYFQSDRTGHVQIWRMHPEGVRKNNSW